MPLDRTVVSIFCPLQDHAQVALQVFLAHIGRGMGGATGSAAMPRAVGSCSCSAASFPINSEMRAVTWSAVR
ncbi:MAG: hypothetical protein IPH04_21540 [Saprospirales bacterium]|nr:hypothetical protein [Saprospirales bacterium]